MILVDSSAWVEFLRQTGSPIDLHVRHLLEDEQPLATTSVVLMEVLAGGRDEAHADQLKRLLLGGRFIPIDPDDYEDAATLYRECRRAGEPIRHVLDCLIAVVAIHAQAELLHADPDFATIARHSALRTVQLPAEGS